MDFNQSFTDLIAERPRPVVPPIFSRGGEWQRKLAFVNASKRCCSSFLVSGGVPIPLSSECENE